MRQLFPISYKFVRVVEELLDHAADRAAETLAFEKFVGVTGRGGFGRQTISAAVTLQEPGGGLPAFAAGNFAYWIKPRLQTRQADSLGEVRIAAHGVVDAAARHADELCGLGYRAAEAQQVAEFVTPGFVEHEGPAAARGG